jgi:hypothetical protein
MSADKADASTGHIEHQAGFEPAAYATEGRCSVRAIAGLLSYRCMNWSVQHDLNVHPEGHYSFELCQIERYGRKLVGREGLDSSSSAFSPRRSALSYRPVNWWALCTAKAAKQRKRPVNWRPATKLLS